MSIIYLTSEDFVIDNKHSVQPTNDKVLCLRKAPPLLFVMFHADGGKCKICDNIMPFVQTLPKIFRTCAFGLVNINKNMNIVKESQKTITNITYVPYFIFYVNGRPAMRYDAPRTPQDMTAFLKRMMELYFKPNMNIEKQEQRNDIDQTQQYEIPAYSVGIPFNLVCDEDMCYIKYEDAYKKPN